MLHKVKYHARDGNGKTRKLYTFFDDLINEETVYSSDEEFDYTFMIITSVMQTPKEYFHEPERQTELRELEPKTLQKSSHTLPTSKACKPNDSSKATCEICGLERSSKNMRRHMQLVHRTIPDGYLHQPEPNNEFTELDKSMDLDFSEDIPSHQSTSLSSDTLCDSIDTKKSICQICGRKRSAKNMRRHMLLVHKAGMDVKFQANISGELEENIENEPIIDQLPGEMGVEDPLDFSVFEAINLTNIKSETEYVPKTFDEENIGFIKEEEISPEFLLEDETSLNNSISCKILQSDVTTSHEKCPICLKTITNIRRHLINAHKLSESEIKEISLRFCSRCSVCEKLVYTRIIKKHFKDVHNITDDAEIDILHVNYWAETTIYSLRNNMKPEQYTDKSTPLHAVDMNPAAITSFQIFCPAEKRTENRKPNQIEKSSSRVTPPKAQLPALKPFQCRCPLCLKAGHHTNIKRHLKLVHKLSTWQISETLKLIDIKELPNQKPTTVRIPLKCTICDFETSTAMFMRLHNRSEHNSKTSLNAASLKKSTIEVGIKCKKCYFTTASPSEMQQHNILAHTIPISVQKPASSIQCEDPSDVEPIFSDKSIKQIDTNVPVLRPSYCLCPLCLKAGHHTNIKRHLRLVHKLNTPQIAEAIKQIDKRTLTRQDQTYIATQIESNSNHKHSSFECYICKYNCRGENSLRFHYNSEHLADENSKPPVSLIERKRRKRSCTCGLCKTEFSSRLLVLKHLINDHLDAINEMTDERFDCDICSRVLDSFAEYEIHQQRTHIYKREQTPHLCSVCGKYQQSSVALKIHINTHTNTRLYACNVCNKSFTAKTTLSEHMLVHTGEKRYVCSVDGCDAAYAQRSGLTQHKILRHLESRHQCEYCGQKFPLLRYLK